MDTSRTPFLFGTQYYRAPTPDAAHWKDDLAAIRDLGFNAVKYFVQWRWSHRSPRQYFFEDLDRLMDLAGEQGLGVTLNILLDMSPTWLFDRHPDAMQVDASGRTILPRAVGHRSIGGHPGPCYRHPGALALRKSFVECTIAHFRGHPALQMWDVWNEPELSFPQRRPDLATLACYCPHCAQDFGTWLHRKYGSLERLNAVWGRCYSSWPQVEMARDAGTYTDFVDWREFHLDTMAEEAAWRLEAVRAGDPAHARYLHVVPNSFFSAVTCADDFAMAEHCEIFAASMNGKPETMAHVVSAGRGRLIYNVESHVNFGGTDMHQRILRLEDLRAELVPQLGAGVKGFLFWQYRSEVLGAESPGWGLVRADGSPRPVTTAARKFWHTLRPHAAALRRAFPAPAEIGIWRSRKNEIFHFCMQGTVDRHNAAINACIHALYWDNLPHALVSDAMLAEGALDGIRLLVMPNPYYLTQEQADALDRWVRAGGVLLCEAHLAGYDGTTGRHSAALPGCGLAASWGIRETESTSSRYLPRAMGLAEATAADHALMSDDIRKALRASEAAGGVLFPLRLQDGSVAWGAHRYAVLASNAIESLANFDGPCIVRAEAGSGQVFYCGTSPCQAAAEGAPDLLRRMIRTAAAAAGVGATAAVSAESDGTVHVDVLLEGGAPTFAVMASRGEKEQAVRITSHGTWRGLFSGVSWPFDGETEIRVPAAFVDIFSIEAGTAGGTSD